MISPHCYQTEYEQKLCSFQEAVEVVRSGDVLEYGSFALFPYGLDEALAARAGSLDNIRIRTVTASCVPKAVLADPMGTHFVWNDWHYSGVGRKFQEAGSISFIPSSFHQSGKAVDLYEDCVCFIAASPMDCHGFFNVGVSNSFTQNCIKKARCIVIEENPSMPVCLGGYGESISISQVDRVVRGAPRPVLSVGNKEASPAEIRIAELIVDRIQNKSCVQLGIGALPNVIGKMLSQSKLRDLGVHTEMMVDAYVDMYEAGCITGKYKTTDPEKMVYTFALGTQRLYDFIDRNPSCASFPADYTNNPGVIARNDRTVSINNALEVDLYGQAA
ncbi:MAG: acetyl-CoA hydrolase/transferase C-terminal domain-containing protein, partial [Oscillospiraceae bacterium]